LRDQKTLICTMDIRFTVPVLLRFEVPVNTANLIDAW